jgi:hypothetical protein
MAVMPDVGRQEKPRFGAHAQGVWTHVHCGGKSPYLHAESASGIPEDLDSAVSRVASGGAMSVDDGRAQHQLHAVIVRL